MDIRFTSDAPEAVACDLLAVATTGDLERDLAPWVGRLGAGLLDLCKAHGFTGASGTSLVVPTLGAAGPREVLFLGVDAGRAPLVHAAARAGRSARPHRARHVALAFGKGSADAAAALVEAVGAGNYSYDRYKRETERTPAIETLTLVGIDPTATDACIARIAAQNFARELTNAPPADLYPETLAAAARTLSSIPDVAVEVWDEDRLEAEGCVGIIAVGQGSARKPRLIHIRYRPSHATAHVALVGKGVTFDAGGLSLKPPKGMQTMRSDMGGAAAVLGATQAIATLKLPVAVDCFVGAAENMVSGDSYKLGDVLSYANGVTVEIHNTDAEGRLVLADCLIRACAVPGVTHVIDAATLTGAAVVAVGPDFTGLFTHDDALADALSAAAVEAGEGIWRLPLHLPYKEMLKADWAQIKNVGGRDAGASTAALFLSHFVDDSVSWAHLDIAGPAFLEKGNGRWAAGATGQPVRTLVSWAERLA